MTQSHVRRLALALPEVVEESGRFAFAVPNKGKPKRICWVWMERVHPGQARMPQPKVLAVRTANLVDKDFLLSADPAVFFTEPHYNGFPAVLVRLDQVKAGDLKPLLWEAWRAQAPRDLVNAHPTSPWK